MMWEAATTEEDARSRSLVVVALVSEGKHRWRAWQVQGTQWPRAPISMVNREDAKPLASRSLKTN